MIVGNGATTPAPDPSPGNEEGAKRFRARSLVLGFLLCVPAIWITTGQPVDSMFSLLLAPMSILICLIVLNVPLRRLHKSLALSQADLIMIFAITSVASAAGAEWSFVSHNVIHALPYQADYSPLIKDKMLPNIPDWLAIKDPALAKDMANGGRGMGHVFGYLPELLPRYLGWGAFIGLICLSMLCVNS